MRIKTVMTTKMKKAMMKKKMMKKKMILTRPEPQLSSPIDLRERRRLGRISVLKNLYMLQMK